ncbi:chemotaxis protein CheA [Syntrophobacter fumaroxidans]|nr:chemotaxis protein CheA [Syntrophobacter fumaroxidans]
MAESQDFLQEYVEEVKEHLQELEHSLLVLEKEGTNKEEINQIFRAAHSIKGASAYMGLEGLANLTHRLESLISEIQSQSRPVPPEGITVMLSCVDFVANAVRQLQETGMEPALPESLLEDLHDVLSLREAEPEVPPPLPDEPVGVVPEPDASAAVSPMAMREEFDQVRLDIGSEDLEAALDEMDGLIEKHRQSGQSLDAEETLPLEATEPEGDFHRARDFPREEAPSEPGFDAVETLLGATEPEGDFHRAEDFLRKEVSSEPGFDEAGACLREEEQPVWSLDEMEEIQEEDQELYKIFLKAFSEGLTEIGGILESSTGDSLPEADADGVRDIIRRLIASSQYMDYEKLAAALSEWENRMNRLGKAPPAYQRAPVQELFESHRRRFRDILPGLRQLSDGDSGKGIPEDTGASPEEDEELFSIFSDSFREAFAELANRITISPESILSEDELEASRSIIKRMIMSSQYMDYQDVANALIEMDESILNTSRQSGAHGEFLLAQLNDYGARLQKMIPGLDLPFPLRPDESPQANREGMSEEDGELLTIFLDSFRELYFKLHVLIPEAPGEFLSAENFEQCLELFKRLKSSSQYMDYEEVLNLVNEVEINFQHSHLSGLGDGQTLSELLHRYGKRLENALPGLAQLSPTAEAVPESAPAGESVTALDTGIDQIDLLITPDQVMPENLSADDIAPEAPVPDTKPPVVPTVAGKEKEPKPDLPARSTEKKQQKGRVVTVAEEIAPSSTLRVDAQKVDQLLNQVGELVVTRSEFIQFSTSFRDMLREIVAQGKLTKQEVRRLRAFSFRLNESTISLGRVANDLQDSVMRIRMLPISFLFQRFPRVVRDQSLKLGKKVELLVEGGETEIDKRVLEQMNDPIVQFLRNAIAHGIETPEERKRASKPETGMIRLSAFHQGDYVTLQIEDDGRGIDTKKLRTILEERRELSTHELERLSDQELMYAIFLPGVSTHEGVDETAGRGVGLDVVKENVERMNGAIEVESYAGLGTRFTIKIPLTVAIIRALLVKGAQQIFTIPLSTVSEILRYTEDATHTIEGFEVISLRGKTIPLVHIGKLLKMSSVVDENEHRSIVIVATSFREVGLVVDGLLGEREVVIKPLEDGVHKFDGFSGATLLGDGTVSLILDVSSLLRIMKDAFRDPRMVRAETLH